MTKGETLFLPPFLIRDFSVTLLAESTKYNDMHHISPFLSAIY